MSLPRNAARHERARARACLEKLDEAGDNSRTLLNLRKRISRNSCLLIQLQVQAIFLSLPTSKCGNENTINERRKEHGRKSKSKLNFRGIELRDFPAEVARLALIIAGIPMRFGLSRVKGSSARFLPLSTENWITCGNALRIDWLSVCPPTGKPSALLATDLFLKTK